MKNSDHVSKEFKSELQALLDKYGAELSAEDHYKGYPECGEDVRMTVEIPGIYVDGEILREWTDIDLGSRVFPNKAPDAAAS